MKHAFRALATAAFLAHLAPASGHAIEDGTGGSIPIFAANESPGKLPAGVPKSPVKRGTRFVILELHQAQRNVEVGDPRINLMFDSRSGKTWVLQFSRLPGSAEVGYVWVEVPQRAAPKPRRRRR